MTAFIFQYWYIFAIALILLAFYGLRFLAKGTAKAVALKYLLAFEQSVFKTSDLEVGVAAHAAYEALPLKVKMFVPEALFETLVGELYAEVKKLIADLEAKNQSK